MGESEWVRVELFMKWVGLSYGRPVNKMNRVGFFVINMPIRIGPSTTRFKMERTYKKILYNNYCYI